MIRPSTTSSKQSQRSIHSHQSRQSLTNRSNRSQSSQRSSIHSNNNISNNDNDFNDIKPLEEIKEDPNNDDPDIVQPEIIQDVVDVDDSGSDDDDDDDFKQDTQHIPQRSNTLTELRDTVRHSWISLKRGISHFLNPTAYLKSRGLTIVDIEELQMLYPLNKHQFCTLIDEFLRLCGVDIYDETQNEILISNITMDRLMENIYLRYVPFKARIQTLFEIDLLEEHPENDNYLNELTFFDFCKCLSVFGTDTPKASKIRFAYRIYDMEDDGYISRDNLFDVISMVIGEKYDDDTIKDIVNDTFSNCSLNSDGNIDYQEFNSIVGIGDITANYTIHF